MPAKKKTTAATKPAKSAAKAESKPVKAVTKKKAAVVKATPVKATARKSAAPAVKSVSTAPAVTVIAAEIDVGFGNSIYLRGEGPGLSWDRGVMLDCLGDDRWSITLPETSQPIVCKFLLNDAAWCVGNDYIITPGSTVVFTPRF